MSGSVSGESSSQQVNKTGRRGDPRMHRAVQARLDNPDLSLFEALRLGGFDYSVDNDAHALDGDNVTLGQRKNQLSRRLRFARKQGQGSSKPSTPNVQSAPAKRKLKAPPESFQPAAKRASASLDDLPDENISEESDDDTGRAALKAKNHPDFRPLHPSQVMPLTGHGGSANSIVGNRLGADTVLVNNGPANNLNGAGGGIFNPPANPHSLLFAQHAFAPNPTNFAGMLGSSAGMMRNSHLPHPSGVAIATLNAAAHSVGMTLEQLALSLSRSSTNLIRVLAGEGSEEANRKREELALNLHMNESRGLYQRSMLLAGYSIEDVREGGPKFLRFAIAAWQQEGKRLQAMKAKLPDDAPMFMPEESGEDGHDHGHSHAHTHARSDSTACAFDERGRHIHRLDGCGHKPILHNPENGVPHIDFVVGNKVECYQGLNPVATSTDKNVWPSQYMCSGVSCEGACDEKKNNHKHTESCTGIPRMIDIGSDEFQAHEWMTNFDGVQLDGESLMGGGLANEKSDD